MIFNLTENDKGDSVLSLDEEGIEFLEEGLLHLKTCDPGEEFTTPSLISDDNEPLGVGSFILRRV